MTSFRHRLGETKFIHSIEVVSKEGRGRKCLLRLRLKGDEMVNGTVEMKSCSLQGGADTAAPLR